MTRSSKREERKPLEFDRRTAIGAIAGSVASGMAVPALAQTPDASPVATPAASPVTTEDGARILESDVEGVPDVFLQAPEPFKSYEGTPANGGEVVYTPLIWAPPSTPYDDNQFWQELEKRLGVDRLVVRETPVETYNEKVSTLIASADLGDLFYIHTGIGPTAVINDAISQGAFYDLTDELSGENLQKYPNLAKLPQAMWDDSRVNGRIYGIPQPMNVGAAMTWYRSDWAENLGLAAPTTPDELLELFNVFTTQDPDGNGSDDTYAMSHWANTLVDGMFRVPAGWRKNDDGSLTNAVETDEWVQAVQFNKRIWDSGSIHPDAASIQTSEMISLYYSGRTGAMSAGFGTFFGPDPGRQDAIKRFNPDATLAPIMPFSHDGGDVYVYPEPSYFGTVAIPEAAVQDSDRLETLLRICDFFYPPFGSEEYIFQSYGLEDVHHTIEDGIRVLTEKGQADLSDLIYGFKVQDLYIYHPGFEDHTVQRQQILEDIVPKFVRNPVQGLFSEIDNEKGPVLGELVGGAVGDMVFGRRPIEDISVVQQEWRERGGDEVRADYERLLKELEEA